MTNDGRDSGGPDDYDVVHYDSVLGWGGIVIGPDGFGWPMDEVEALAGAIPAWVNIPEHLEDAVGICLEVVSRPEAVVRTAALAAFAAIARRYGRMPQRDAVARAVANARRDPEAAVRAAASEAAQALAQLPRD